MTGQARRRGRDGRPDETDSINNLLSRGRERVRTITYTYHHYLFYSSLDGEDTHHFHVVLHGVRCRRGNCGRRWCRRDGFRVLLRRSLKLQRLVVVIRRVIVGLQVVQLATCDVRRLRLRRHGDGQLILMQRLRRRLQLRLMLMLLVMLLIYVVVRCGCGGGGGSGAGGGGRATVRATSPQRRRLLLSGYVQCPRVRVAVRDC